MNTFSWRTEAIMHYLIFLQKNNHDRRENYKTGLKLSQSPLSQISHPFYRRNLLENLKKRRPKVVILCTNKANVKPRGVRKIQDATSQQGEQLLVALLCHFDRMESLFREQILYFRSDKSKFPLL